MDLRVGIGFDAHALEAGHSLVLGGVSFDYPRGLAGHSDGDVIAHALIDAILGAANHDPAQWGSEPEKFDIFRARPDGTGLLGLADRLAALDGRLRIETAPSSCIPASTSV